MGKNGLLSWLVEDSRKCGVHGKEEFQKDCLDARNTHLFDQRTGLAPALWNYYVNDNV
jgi:hypothetical protein